MQLPLPAAPAWVELSTNLCEDFTITDNRKTHTRVFSSSGIYGISGISMDIPEISMFQDPATHCHQIRRHTFTLYLITGDMKQLRMSTFKE